MKTKYSSPEIKIEVLSDFVTTSVETDKIPVSNSVDQTLYDL